MQQIQSKVTLVDICGFSRSSSFTNAFKSFFLCAADSHPCSGKSAATRTWQAIKSKNSFAVILCVQLYESSTAALYQNQIKDDMKHIAMGTRSSELLMCGKRKLPPTMRNNKLFIKLLSSSKHESENDIKQRINLLCFPTKRPRITERSKRVISKGSLKFLFQEAFLCSNSLFSQAKSSNIHCIQLKMGL